jgi:hypothetical protein
MRSHKLVYLGLIVAWVASSALLWNALRTERLALQVERQASEELRNQLVQARAERAPSPAPIPVVAATTDAQPPGAATAKTPAQLSAELLALAKEEAKRQRQMLQDAGYRQGRIAELRVDLKKYNPLLARELGVSEQQAEKVLDLLAEGQYREEARALDLEAAGTGNEAAAVAETNRQLEADRLQQKNALMALLGPAKYEQLQDVQDTRIAHSRMVNLRNLLVQSGQPLSTEQDLAFTKVIGDQQKREERETQQLRASGQLDPARQFDRAAEGDRRILDDAASILTPRQLETIRARFEQRAAMERAQGSVQSRERHGIQATPN